MLLRDVTIYRTYLFLLESEIDSSKDIESLIKQAGYNDLLVGNGPYNTDLGPGRELTFESKTPDEKRHLARWLLTQPFGKSE